MKFLRASAIAGIALAMPQDAPSGRFGTNDIQTMITNMGASGDAALALYKQFRELSGFERLLASNQAIAIASFSGFGAGYGCWCYFGDNHLLKEAKGVPLDDIDEACHGLSRGYECAIRDTDGCIPWNVDYEIVPFGIGSDFFDLCTTANAALGKCAIDACAVESEFVSTIQDAFNTGTSVEPTFVHSDPNFEANIKDVDCVGNSAGNDFDIQCCGVVPTRYPFNILAPNKQCCTDGTDETQVFNNAFEQCCADGSVIGIGETC
jgi:hypothetical protein